MFTFFATADKTVPALDFSGYTLGLERCRVQLLQVATRSLWAKTPKKIDLSIFESSDLLRNDQHKLHFTLDIGGKLHQDKANVVLDH